jgi:hypothetical protein
VAILQNKIDPVESLVDYVLEVKPYHTKIFEVVVEYVHTDVLKAKIKDSVDMCINVGFPDLNTFFDIPILAIDQTNRIITVKGSTDGSIFVGQRIMIAFSENNNGQYYVTSINFDAANNKTLLTVREEIPSTVVDGRVVHSVIDFCPNLLGQNNAMSTTNVLPKPQLICDGGWGTVWDSFTFTVLSVDNNTNSIIIDGDETAKFKDVDNISLMSATNNTVLGLFHIASVSTNNFQTTIQVVNDISSFNIPTNQNLSIFVKNVGWDVPLDCVYDNNGGRSEVLKVGIKDDLHIELEMGIDEKISTKNWEGRARQAWDTIDFGVINSPTTPAMPETITPPPVPALFDLWFDTSVKVLKQFHNWGWKEISYVYWFQPNATDIQQSKYYKRTKNSTQDSGWYEVIACETDELSCAWDVAGWSVEPYTYNHSLDMTRVNTADNTLELMGGDFSTQLKDTDIIGYGSTGKLGTWSSDKFFVDGVLSGNRIVISAIDGDLTNFFKIGGIFYFDTNILNKKWLTVDSVNYDGTNTTITVIETLDISGFAHEKVGTISGLLYIPAHASGALSWNGHPEPTTIIKTATNIHPDIDIIEYTKFNPYVFDLSIDNSEGAGTGTSDTFGPSFSEDIQFVWGPADPFQYTILSFDVANNSMILSSNASADIHSGQNIEIFGTGVSNAGIYEVNFSLFNGTDTLISLVEPLTDSNATNAFVKESP